MIKLSPQQYAGVLLTLQNAAASGASDKRKFSRMQVQAPIRVGSIVDSKIAKCFVALSRDISMGGIGLCQALQIGANEAFLIELTAEKHRLLMICSAMFCRPLADGIYWVGAQFESMADETKFGEFLKLQAPKTPHVPQSLLQFCGVSKT